MSKFLFKCRFYYEYNHFARNCKKKSEEELQSEKEDQWTQAKKAGKSNQDQRKKGTDGKKLKGDVDVGKLPHPQVV